MNKLQTNHYQMFLSTQALLDNNGSLWSTIPRIVSYKNLLDEVISRIQAKVETTKQEVGVTLQKNQLKITVATKSTLLSGVLQIIAAEQSNDDLAAAVKMSYSDFTRLRDADMDAAAKNIISKANENLETLAEFGITEDVITELSTSVEDFNAFIGKPRTILSQKYAALNSIEELFVEGNVILKQKLDSTMLIFKATQSEFFQGYQNARTIINN